MGRGLSTCQSVNDTEGLCVTLETVGDPVHLGYEMIQFFFGHVAKGRMPQVMR